MKFLVDANVFSEATRPDPDPRVLDWLARNEPEIAVDPIVLGEIRFGILLLPAGKRRERLESWFQEGVGRGRKPKPAEPPAPEVAAAAAQPNPDSTK